MNTEKGGASVLISVQPVSPRIFCARDVARQSFRIIVTIGHKLTVWKEIDMQYNLLKSKIHKARITQADLHYEGSLGIDLDLMEACEMKPYERILVVNATNGARLETYAIAADRGSKCFILNGAAARLGEPGDVITIMNFALYDDVEQATHKPTIIVMNESNDIIEKK
jgi:aspartate 1-decarboxylase